jgi:hypothetical protein
MTNITILTVTYNRAALLERCLNSLLPQMESGDEFVVVDDWSTDDTQARLMALWPVRSSTRTRPEESSRQAQLLAPGGPATVAAFPPQHGDDGQGCPVEADEDLACEILVFWEFLFCGGSLGEAFNRLVVGSRADSLCGATLLGDPTTVVVAAGANGCCSKMRRGQR